MKAEIKALFESKYQDDGLTAYFAIDEIAENEKHKAGLQKCENYNEKYGTLGFTGFKGKWNADWEKGKVVEFDAETKKAKNGKTYANFKCPEHLKQKGGADLTPVMNDLSQIKENQRIILKNQELILKQFEQSADTGKEINKKSDDIDNMDDLPF